MLGVNDNRGMKENAMATQRRVGEWACQEEEKPHRGYIIVGSPLNEEALAVSDGSSILWKWQGT